MSFERKWVSDTNLSKLLHETIEKREANKQSVSPDFCKDAILGATIKRISSAMLFKPDGAAAEAKHASNQEHGPQVPNSDGSCDMDGVQFLIKTDPCNLESTDRTMHIVDVECLTEKDNSCSSESDLRDITHSLTLERGYAALSNSPKRKRKPSSEAQGASVGLSSPSKRTRQVEQLLMPDSPRSDCDDSCTNDQEWHISEETSLSNMLSRHRVGQRSHSLPHLSSVTHTEKLVASKTNKLSPLKSVVNSISGLSIRDCWEPNMDGSWCLPQKELVDADPLELNVFFQELKSVTGSL